MSRAGFEPAHPKIVGLKSTALDHSAMMTFFSFLGWKFNLYYLQGEV